MSLLFSEGLVRDSEQGKILDVRMNEVMIINPVGKKQKSEISSPQALVLS